ncbi:uncharacterized protein LOC126898288 [Daktulosphaira vitifoliae]|uniref:uncharacterized protein LOC126898288 n=1 Tax=Daktulosphaira vitifoliae TaxID=58002 RepID=UPI0021AA5D1F|nr:uncharacterized protein LOC126898288 [Daktulosphaira vitifoliae]
MSGIANFILAFEPEREPFKNYLDRLEAQLTVLKVKEADKANYLIAYIGPETYNHLKVACLPDEPGDKVYDELITILEGIFSPRRLVVSERFKFNQRVQRAGESIKEFIDNLKNLANFCEFDDTLRDRLIVGLKDESIQRKLLAEKTLKFEKACKIALNSELFGNQTSQINQCYSQINAVTKLYVKFKKNTNNPTTVFNKNINKFQGKNSKFSSRSGPSNQNYVRDPPQNQSSQINDNCVPRFHRAYQLPYALRSKVEDELSHLKCKNKIFKVVSSEWALPIVVVPKNNGKIRICVDFKITVNPALRVDQHPLPRVEEVFNEICNFKVFTVVDLSDAYLQLKVAPSSLAMLTINTYKGLYQYNRLCYGVASAPAKFQATMENLLLDIPNV